MFRGGGSGGRGPSNWFTSLKKTIFNIVLNVLQGGFQRAKDFRECVSGDIRVRQTGQTGLLV